jgi:hypothetical protein
VRAKIRALLCMKTYTRDTASSVIMLHTNQWIEATDPKHRCGGLPRRILVAHLVGSPEWPLGFKPNLCPKPKQATTLKAQY